jgi:peptidoglycan/LPS O-acetylase OafA/YrhL
MGTVRFLLALSVVVGHGASAGLFGIKLFDGGSAVQCFYIISGFLITMVLNERKDYRSLRNFYFSRFLRLWPVYIAVAAASLVLLNWELMFVQLPGFASWSAITFIWFSNLTLLFQDWFLFLGFDNGRLVPVLSYLNSSPGQVWQFLLVPQCWSLGVELTFYLIAPFACRRWQSVAMLFAFGLASRAVLAWFVPLGDPWTYRFAPAEMMMFAAGGLAYFAGRDLCPRFPRVTMVACLASLAAIGLFIFAESYAFQITGRWAALTPLLLIYNGAALLLMTVAAAPLFYGTRNNRIDQIAGELSYPMYVSHYTIMLLLARNGILTPNNGLYVLIVISVSIALYYCITVPTDNFRRRFGARNQINGSIEHRLSASR